MVRMHWLARGSALAALIAGAGCSAAGDDHDGFSSQEWAAIKDIQPLGKEMPRNLYNKRDLDPGLVTFGQKLFFDTAYSDAIATMGNPAGMMGQTGKVSCASCHDPKAYFVDTRIDPTTMSRFATSYSLNAPGKRATPGMLNEGYYDWVGWTGRHDSLIMHGSGVAVFVSSHTTLIHYIYDKYKNEYNGLFPENQLPDALDMMAQDASRFPRIPLKPKANATAADGKFEMMIAPDDQKLIFQFMYNMARVWDTYPRALVTHGSAFERYVKDSDFGALSPEAKRGLKVFIGKAACNDCHNGPTLTDNLFHNVGVPQPAGGMADTGRMGDLAATKANIYNGAGIYSDDPVAGQKKLDSMPPIDDAMNGVFRTPTLLNIAETYPYFHTGQVRTLAEVVAHYNKGGAAADFSGAKDIKMKPLDLNEGEIADLVAFLQSLTGVVDPDLTKDIRTP
jgi:cytochrome c peroxidase